MDRTIDSLETARLLGVSEWTVHRLARGGKLKRRRVGPIMVFDLADVLALRDARATVVRRGARTVGERMNKLLTEATR